MPDEATQDGTSGNDTLTGGAGADAFVFDPDHGNDVVTDFTNGEDVIDLSAFSSISDFSDLTITSDENGVTIDLGAHGGGTILLQGVAIADLDAEDFRFHAVQAEPVLDGGGTTGNDVLEADDDGDRLDGGDGDDILTGGAGDDILLGREGDDTLRGGDGDDYLSGGGGNDTLYGGEGADTFAFVAGNGADVVGDFSVAGDLIDLSGFAGITGFGDLTITGESDGVVIDLSEFGGGTVKLQDVTLADLSADHFVFQSRDGWIEDDDGTNWVQGTSGDDTMDGGTGDDYVFGREGDDLIFGGEGNDRLYGDLEGQSGNDTNYGDAGEDHVLGGAGDDELHGGKGDDWIDGGAGNDELSGGAGNDTLYANWGDNTLEGGEGEDTFAFIPSPSGGTNVITDFADGEDNIDLSRIEGISGFEDLTITADGNDAVIDLSGHGAGTIRLQNTSVDDLDATDFLFDPPPTTVEDGG